MTGDYSYSSTNAMPKFEKLDYGWYEIINDVIEVSI